jgi:hypothetical protein
MSTKTLSKRIALATVVALGAGVLSLVSTTSANAATFQGSSTTNATPAAGNLNIATVSSPYAYPVAEVASNTGRSVGLLSYGDIGGTTTSGTTQTATILSTGVLVVYTTNTATNSILYKLTNGIINKDGTTTTLSVNSSLTAAAVEAGGGVYGVGVPNAGVMSLAVKPASGATAFTVSLYQSSAQDTAASLLNGSNAGSLTLIGNITVTVASTNLGGTVSAANSGVWYTGQKTPGVAVLTTALTSDSTTLATPGSIANGSVGYADIRVRDAYGAAVTGTGLLQASATNGALVGFNAAGNAGSTAAPAVGSSSTAFVTVAAAYSADDYLISVAQPASAPISTVVTITYNGTVIGTKSFTFSGQIAKISLSSPVNGKTSNSTGNTVVISFADAAGNTVYPTAAYFTSDAASFGGIVSATTLSTVPSATVVGKVTYTCGTSAGSTNLDVKYTNTDGTVITSNAVKVTCSGAAVSYTAAYDKSSYKPGDIATLVVTFKDSKGNLANDVDSITATGSLATVSTAGVTAITSPDRLDTASNGVIKYTYSVGTATGTFTNPVTFAYVDGIAKGLGLTASGPVAASLTIADGSTSLNDVLKGIVSLIASINKQIAALAKLVTKK